MYKPCLLSLLMMGTFIVTITEAAPCLSQLQVLGTHNSYHQAPPEPIITLLSSVLAKAVVPATAYLPESWQYSHPDITSQLDAGVRALELDVHPDPNGGLYQQPAFLKIAGVDATLNDPLLAQPGFKVIHVPDIDFATSCTTFVSCLQIIKAWSDGNPSHVPITINLETFFGETELVTLLGEAGNALIGGELSGTPNGPQSLVVQPEVSPELLGSLEAEILSVFPSDRIITPDSVRSALGLDGSDDLTQALLQPATATSCPWPDLETLRDKVQFAIILPCEDAVDAYRQLHPNQQGAIAWMVRDSFDIPEAIFYSVAGVGNLSNEGGSVPPEIPPNAAEIINEIAQEATEKAQQGYLVRVRADVDTVEARSGYKERARILLDTPAHIIATDYAMPAEGVDYVVTLPVAKGFSSRCVNGAAEGYTGSEVSCGGDGSAVVVADSAPNTTPVPTTTAPPVDDTKEAGTMPAAGIVEQTRSNGQPAPAPISSQGESRYVLGIISTVSATVFTSFILLH